MSPQEAAKQLAGIKMLLNSTMYFKERQALSLAIAALEREAKALPPPLATPSGGDNGGAEPVAWLVSDRKGFAWATTDKEIAEFSVNRTRNRITPLYAALPPAPGRGHATVEMLTLSRSDLEIDLKFWRELAGELAEAFQHYVDNSDSTGEPYDIACTILARFKQESE